MATPMTHVDVRLIMVEAVADELRAQGIETVVDDFYWCDGIHITIPNRYVVSFGDHGVYTTGSRTISGNASWTYEQFSASLLLKWLKRTDATFPGRKSPARSRARNRAV